MSGVIPTQQERSADQWPPQSPGQRPYPVMPQVPDDKPLLQSLGASGTAIFSGIITSEEYNPDFYWRDGVKIFEQMLRSDAQIRAVRTVVEDPIKRATWSITPGSESPRDKQIASFVQSCLFTDMSYTTADGRRRTQTWSQILHHILMHLWYGFMAFEVVWKKEDGWVKWAKWQPLLPRTVWRWWVGPDTELVGIQQWTFKDWNYAFVDIPADKTLLFVHQQEGANFEGVSLLRTAYKHWWYKQQFEKIEAIGIERNAVVPPVITLPVNFTSSDLQAAQTLGANMRANELAYATLPPGMLLDYPAHMQPFTSQVQPAIQYHDVMIARNVLAQFINLGSTETGAYALADAQQEMFLQALQAVAASISDVVSADAIKRLVDYNFSGVEVYPRLKCSRLANADISQVAEALSKLKARDANFITPNPELEDYLAEEFGFPKPPRSAVTATNPTSAANAQRPDIQPGAAADHASQQSANVSPAGQKPGGNDQAQATAGNNALAPAAPSDGGPALSETAGAVKHTGVMIAFPLAPDVAKRLAWPGGEPANDLHITLAFLGDSSDLSSRERSKLKTVVSDYVADQLPLRAHVTGVGSFPPGPHSDGKRPVYAKVDIEGVQGWRQGLVDKLKAAGLPVDETFAEYTPHITLAYVPANAPLPTRGVPDMTITLDKVICAIGDEHTAHAIGAEQLALSGAAAEVRLLREAVEAIARLDAVERGVAHERKLLYNPNHDPHSGEFSSGGGGAGEGGGATRSGGGRSGRGSGAKAKAEKTTAKPRASRASKTGAKAEESTPTTARERQHAHEAEAQHEAEAARVALHKRDAAYAAGRDEASNRYHAEAQAHSSAQREAEIAAQREATIARSQDEHGNQLPEARPGEHTSMLVNPSAPEEQNYLKTEFPRLYQTHGDTSEGSAGTHGEAQFDANRATDARLIAHLYGEHQTAATLSKFSVEELRASADHHGLDTKGTKDALVSRLTTFATGGRYRGSFKPSAGEAHAAKAAKPEEDIHARSARLQREQGLRAEAPPHTDLVPVRSTEGRFYDPLQPLDPGHLAELYGEHQLGAALSGYKSSRLAEAAAIAGVRPGRTNADTVSRITAHLTGGRYSANFGHTSSGRSSRDPFAAHAAKAAKLKTALDKAQAAFDAHMANAPKQASEQSAHAREAARLLAVVERAQEALEMLDGE